MKVQIKHVTCEMSPLQNVLDWAKEKLTSNKQVEQIRC